MKNAKLYLLIAGAAAATAYALSRFGRSAVAGGYAGDIGDQEAKDLAASLSFFEALVAGARSITGKHTPLTTEQRNNIYTVS
jgi:hypothetical protein